MMLPGFLCATCGVQYPASETPPSRCPVCEDERQYVPASGQQWTTPVELAAGHTNTFREMTPGLLALGTVPKFAIGQRAFLLRTAHGNVLWDCLSLLDTATVTLIEALGGLKAIVISHPHYYATMVSWGRAFGCPVYVHAADREWIMVPDAVLHPWEGEALEVLPGVTAHRLGGHFPGASVLHWETRELLLTGDTLLVTPDRMASFMWSYPNNIPLPASEVAHIGERLQRLDFGAVYAAFWHSEITADAGPVVALSVARHCQALEGGRAS
ncbi:MBL fold metallo-hydrolase [Chromohalobacter canadensis]|uniref:MBL fold metallo-hydrolase n=1 Tax=Chromohalobacter moromii TaxID=2860329 RepID=A0A9X2X092_9GAMM|nr:MULTISPECIES: MBL fold metallo-hydrolase [Chromohalobacter]MCT8467479.1 MBL fold metallo-hydrolase [Chromohalobacter canadensis]MCT8470773.1 MBL fold metallo-hydrolase [Chromohalobacter canadensis]MCT8497976.1 MBL fold metallo-hydrolase [Chromohalobacter canadensis]MCT8504340.1 MBL fold metallo-hydrolase [Chromohalobacter moromii]